MSLIDILQPALDAFNAATTGQTPVEDAIDAVSDDPRVRVAMRMGAALEGGNLVGGWAAGDSGTSFGPWQIHLPAHPDVTQQQAEDPSTAAQVMAAAYSDAVDQVPPEMWQDDPANAAVLAAYYAERPLNFYSSGQITGAKSQLGVNPLSTPTPPPSGTPVPGGGNGGSGDGGSSTGGFSSSDFGGGTGKITVKNYHGHFYVFDDQGNIISDTVTEPTPLELQQLQNDTTRANATAQDANASTFNAATGARNANTSAAAQQETARSNRVQEQIDYIGRLTAQQQADDAAAENGKKNMIDVLPYLTSEHYWIGPDDPAVKEGLTTPTQVTAVPFNPNLAKSAAGAQALAQLEAMANR